MLQTDYAYDLKGGKTNKNVQLSPQRTLCISYATVFTVDGDTQVCVGLIDFDFVNDNKATFITPIKKRAVGDDNAPATIYCDTVFFRFYLKIAGSIRERREKTRS